MNEDIDENYEDFLEECDDFKEELDNDFEPLDEAIDIKNNINFFEPRDEDFNVDKRIIDEYESLEYTKSINLEKKNSNYSKTI